MQKRPERPGWLQLSCPLWKSDSKEFQQRKPDSSTAYFHAFVRRASLASRCGAGAVKSVVCKNKPTSTLRSPQRVCIPPAANLVNSRCCRRHFKRNHFLQECLGRVDRHRSGLILQVESLAFERNATLCAAQLIRQDWGLRSLPRC